jgi:ribose 5-phosphate isomerase B
MQSVLPHRAGRHIPARRTLCYTRNMAKTLIVGADHAGVELKKQLVNVARDLGFQITDLGAHSTEPSDYPDPAHQVAKAVSEGEGIGLLVCGSGLGMAMAANRHPGVRAAVCDHPHVAEMARRFNDANVLCIGARMVGAYLAEQILKDFLTSTFEGGRHERRVRKIERSTEG